MEYLRYQADSTKTATKPLQHVTDNCYRSKKVKQPRIIFKPEIYMPLLRGWFDN